MHKIQYKDYIRNKLKMHDKCNMRNKTMHKMQDKCYLIVTKIQMHKTKDQCCIKRHKKDKSYLRDKIKMQDKVHKSR